MSFQPKPMHQVHPARSTGQDARRGRRDAHPTREKGVAASTERNDIHHIVATRRWLSTLAWLLGGVLGVRALAMAEDPVPKAVPATKYAKMAAHSPFAPPTAVAVAQATPPPPPAPGWADSLTATMIMQDGNKYTVTVVDSSNQQQHLYLTTEPDGQTQMSVASVKWGATREDPPTITLRKGRETAQVRYETGSSAPGAANGMGGAAPPMPGGVRSPGPAIPGGAGAAAAFHPPLQNGQANGGPSTAIRRPLIHAQPVPAGRPVINAPANGVRPNPAAAKAAADDDDDDD